MDFNHVLGSFLCDRDLYKIIKL